MSLAELVVTELSFLENLQIYFVGSSSDGIKIFNTIPSRVPSIRVSSVSKGASFEWSNRREQNAKFTREILANLLDSRGCSLGSSPFMGLEIAIHIVV